MEDMEIVALYWARSEDAIAETAEKYGGYCHSISFRILRNEQDAEECVTDTYYRAWNTMSPKRPDRLAAFLGKITRNLSLDRYRRRTAKMRGRGQVTVALEELEQSVPSHDSVEDQVSAAALTDSLNRFLCGLPTEKRRVFLLRYWYFLKVEEIAERLGCSEAKVSSMLHRTRKELKAYLEGDGIGL